MVIYVHSRGTSTSIQATAPTLTSQLCSNLNYTTFQSPSAIQSKHFLFVHQVLPFQAVIHLTFFKNANPINPPEAPIDSS